MSLHRTAQNLFLGNLWRLADSRAPVRNPGAGTAGSHISQKAFDVLEPGSGISTRAQSVSLIKPLLANGRMRVRWVAVGAKAYALSRASLRS